MSVKDYYYDPKIGYISANKLYIKLREKGVKVSKKDVVDFVKRQETVQINKPIRKPRQYDSIVSLGALEDIQIDVVIYDRYSYRGYRYIFNIVDVFSRKAWSYALKDHKIKHMMNILKELFDDIGQEPNNINSDNEFNKSSFIKAFPNVKFWFSDKEDYVKNAIVERFNRTLTSQLNKVRTATGNNNWPSYLDSVVFNYNNTVHQTIQTTPEEAFTKGVTYQQNIIRTPAKFSIDDKVRHIRPPSTFEKSDVATYSSKIYDIESVKGKTYKLKGLTKRFKEYELIPANSEGIEKKKALEYLSVRKEKRKRDRRFKREGIEKQPELRTRHKRDI